MLVPSDGNHFMEIYMLVGAEQAREVVTLVTSEAPSSLLWVETSSLVGHNKQYGFFLMI